MEEAGELLLTTRRRELPGCGELTLFFGAVLSDGMQRALQMGCRSMAGARGHLSPACRVKTIAYTSGNLFQPAL